MNNDGRTPWSWQTLAGGAALLALALSAPGAASASEAIEKYKANAVATSAGARSSMVEINIYRWSSEEERQELLQVIKDAADDKSANRELAKALRGQPKAGYVFLAGRQGWPLRYSREIPKENGRQILLATDRPVSFREVYQHAYIGDFDVSIIVLNLDDSDSGEGIASIGTEVKWNEEQGGLEITNVSSQPVRLGNVRRVD